MTEDALAAFDPGAIAEALAERGVHLQPPASAASLQRLSEWRGQAIHSDFLAMLARFDGFEDHDFEIDSWISVRSVARALGDETGEAPLLNIADEALDALIYACDPATAGPVVEIFSGEVVAPSYRAFWTALLSNSLRR